MILTGPHFKVQASREMLREHSKKKKNCKKSGHGKDSIRWQANKHRRKEVWCARENIWNQLI